MEITLHPASGPLDGTVQLPGDKSISHRYAMLAAAEKGCAELIAAHEGRVAQNAAWARFQLAFAPPRNLGKHQALGVWVEGDTDGALLAVRLESPHHLAFGAVADRYLPLNATGGRFVTLVETESWRWSDYRWDDGKGLYNVYRETIDFAAVETVSVWLQNLPPGREVRCRIGPILALPMVSATARRPVLTVNGNPVELPCDLESGQWLEVDGAAEARVFGPQGESLQTLPLDPASLPRLEPGRNLLRLSCHPGSGVPPRLKVTVFRRGEML